MIFIYNHVYDLDLVQLFLFYIFYYTGTARALGHLPRHLGGLLPTPGFFFLYGKNCLRCLAVNSKEIVREDILFSPGKSLC